MNEVKILDSEGHPFGYKLLDGKPRVSATPYLYSIAEDVGACSTVLRGWIENN